MNRNKLGAIAVNSASYIFQLEKFITIENTNRRRISLYTESCELLKKNLLTPKKTQITILKIKNSFNYSSFLVIK